MITSNSCSKCKVVKNILRQQNIKFREVEALSDEGQQIVDLFNVKELPYFICDGEGIESYKDLIK